MATKETEIPVFCYELPPFDPSRPEEFKGKPMRPSPLERFTGRFGRRETKRAVRDLLTEKGHNIHAINFGNHGETGVDCLLVYIWAKGAEPATGKDAPKIPPPRVKRTAVSRRHAQRPETRKKR